MSDKRKAPRIGVKVFVDVYLKGKLESKGRGIITNISIGGALLETIENLQLRNILILRLVVAPNVSLHFKGKVIRKEKLPGLNSYGIKFLRMGLFEKVKITIP